jgi:phosphatidylserine/phosphatidylglycerophosphate/cardiolipin synthase-like enzyme
VTPQEFRQVLVQTLADRRLSRAENRALAAALGELHQSPQLLSVYRHMAFELAQESLGDGGPHGEVIGWLEDVVNSLAQRMEGDPAQRPAEACFSPGDSCVQRIRGLFDQSRTTADVCVFTITDDRLSDVILDAHRRGVAIRILTDNEKAYDVGSDIFRFRAAGISTRVDATEYHMHHKFAIFDRRVLVTGSYNWTRSAAEYNEENMLITHDAPAIAQFQKVFDKLWTRCADVTVSGGVLP